MNYELVRKEAAKHVFELYPPDKQRRGFICPLCGNGSGSSGDGVTFIKNSLTVHCFRCNFSGDLIALKSQEHGCSYVDAAKALAVVLGVAERNDERYTNPELVEKMRLRTFDGAPTVHMDFSNDRDSDEEKIDQTEFLLAAEKNLEQTDYYSRRGLSLETARKFRLGFVPNWQHPKITNAPDTPRLIIPTSKYGYLARDVRADLDERQKKYSKQKVGPSGLFNMASLRSEMVFVVEGEFDAMSFYEVGFQALSLGSTSNYQKFIRYILSVPLTRPLSTIFILSLDNDKGGRTTTRTLKMLLDNFGFFNVIAQDIYGKFKDANDALVDDRKNFEDAVKQNAAAAQKKFLSTFGL